MKKLVLLALGFGAFNAFAQQWVSTSPQKRNVILEEFTGIHCGYCPDGHKIANNLVTANAGKVFLINIHAGSFAVPGTGEPDFRTTAGDAIDAAAAVTGYPSGSVNRATSPWGQSRTNWTTLAGTVMGQNSPVNVAVKSSVDFATRKLTTEVEVYYTAASAQAKNYLTVALTEDDILGPQSDYGNYNPTNWVGGQYRHNHVLRQLITAGNMGEMIDTTTSGYYMYKKFETTIPANYKGVPCALHKLNVVAFVTENANGNNILSGAEAKVDFDPSLKADLKVTDLTSKPTMCASSINPKVEVTNIGDQTVGSFEITAIINGASVKQTVSTPLAKNEKTTVDFGTQNFTSGGDYSVSVNQPALIKNADNSKDLIDIDNTNDQVMITGTAFQKVPFNANKVWCGFENTANWSLDLSQNSAVSVPAASSTKIGAYSSSQALRFSLHSSWNVSGKPGNILLGEADLNGISEPGISYFYAYSDGDQNGTAPTIKVSVSSDCGATWTEVSSVTPAETGNPADPTKFYVPASNDYRLVSVPLSNFKNTSIIAKISGIPGSTGNALYIDEIVISSVGSLAVKETATNVGFDVFPNPASGMFTITLPTATKASYSVKDLTGKEVLAMDMAGVSADVNASQLKPGLYIIEVSVDGITTSKKLMIK